MGHYQRCLGRLQKDYLKKKKEELDFGMSFRPNGLQEEFDHVCRHAYDTEFGCCTDRTINIDFL